MSANGDDIQQVVPGLANASCPLPDTVTAGQPREEEIERLAQAGYRTVLDLRMPEEPRGYDEPAAVQRAGMEYISLPVSPGTLGAGSFERFRELMRDAGKRPIVVHCGSANRVGALLLPYLILDEGRTQEQAMEIALNVGLRSRELADAALHYTEGARG